MASKELLLKNLDANGKELENIGAPTAATSATHVDAATTPSPVGTAAPGTSFLAAPADHAHAGVHGVGANGGAVATGDINLVDGSGVTITRVGQDVTIAASAIAGTLNKIYASDADGAYSLGIGEEIIREFYMNFADCGASTITALLAAIVKTTAGIATFALRVGATAPGATTGSTVRATFTSVSTTEELKEAAGSSFANPGGNQLVQVTANSDTAATKNYIRGVYLSIG